MKIICRMETPKKIPRVPPTWDNRQENSQIKNSSLNVKNYFDIHCNGALLSAPFFPQKVLIENLDSKGPITQPILIPVDARDKVTTRKIIITLTNSQFFLFVREVRGVYLLTAGQRTGLALARSLCKGSL